MNASWSDLDSDSTTSSDDGASFDKLYCFYILGW